MKPAERDDLLIRLDERSNNMYRVLTESDDSISKKIDILIEHNARQNGWIIKNTVYRRILVTVTGTLVTALILHLLNVY
ncbi:hypothetical protein LCGC14_0514690 [marine sediment metagenome]|uniref:Uncharacterized protein n=1 Tax=marine sediment metagenome TaxID=412755 RepID=A0A0F9S0A2_9ZZZZ